MVLFIIRRVLFVIPIMLGVTLIIFALRVITPGDPLDQIMPSATTTEEQRDAMRAQLGLDQPIPIQFVRYVKGVFTGDFGKSYQTRQPITDTLLVRLPVSLLISCGSVILGLLIGIPLGVISSNRQYSWVDSVVLFFSTIANATPGFVLALTMIAVFSVKLGWLPAVGITNPLGYIMPMVTIAVSTSSQYTRITRSSMLEVIRQDYIRTARAKGQAKITITMRHSLRNALIPVAAAAGSQLNIQLGGAFIIETVFGVPGIGKYIADSIAVRDFPVIQGGVILLAFVLTIMNLIIDLSFIVINPRLKTSVISGRTRMRKTLLKTAAID